MPSKLYANSSHSLSHIKKWLRVLVNNKFNVKKIKLNQIFEHLIKYLLSRQNNISLERTFWTKTALVHITDANGKYCINTIVYGILIGQLKLQISGMTNTLWSLYLITLNRNKSIRWKLFICFLGFILLYLPTSNKIPTCQVHSNNFS